MKKVCKCSQGHGMKPSYKKQTLNLHLNRECVCLWWFIKHVSIKTFIQFIYFLLFQPLRSGSAWTWWCVRVTSLHPERSPPAAAPTSATEPHHFSLGPLITDQPRSHALCSTGFILLLHCWHANQALFDALNWIKRMILLLPLYFFTAIISFYHLCEVSFKAVRISTASWH